MPDQAEGLGTYVQILTDPSLARSGNKLLRWYSGRSDLCAVQWFGWGESGQYGRPVPMYRAVRMSWWARFETPPLTEMDAMMIWIYGTGLNAQGQWRGTIDSGIVMAGWNWRTDRVGLFLTKLFMNNTVIGSGLIEADQIRSGWHKYELTYVRDAAEGYYELKLDGVTIYRSPTGNTIEFPYTADILEVYPAIGFEWGIYRKQERQILMDDLVVEWIPLSPQPTHILSVDSTPRGIPFIIRRRGG